MIIDQLPLMSGNPQDDDEFPIERGTTTYKTKLQALAAGIFGKIASSATPLMDGNASPGSGTSAARADHVHPSDTSRASAAELATYVRPNLLDNWYFVGGGSQLGYGTFPINQRGQTTYSGSGYCVDRWGSLSGDSHTVELLASGMKVTKGSTGGSWPLWQLVTSPTSIAGKTVTFSVLYKDATNAFTLVLNSYDGSTYASANSDPAVSGGIGLLSVTTTLREADTAVRTVLRLTSGSATIIAAKLEVGSTQTLAHQKDGAWVLNEIPSYVEQLAKCRAYYLHHVGYASVGFLSDTGSAYVNIVTPSTMVRVPTLEVVQYNNLIHGTSIEPITRARISELRKNVVTVEVGVATTGVFELCMTADFMVNLSAE